MIGLKRNTLAIIDHDPSWTVLAAQACQAVRDACGELLIDVQHVGSTAVPNLPAKPIVDLAAAVVTFDSALEVVTRLTRIGYLYRGDHGDSGGHLLVTECAPDIRTIHMHVVEYNGRQWRDYLAFRDLLRHRSAIRKSYAELKRHLASICRDDRKLYTDSKAGFIRRILDDAVTETPD
jgi:GrpB-like predicted nucleotidyltransferase (UPF0157 family)